jgi:hypothetical protein
MLLNYKTEGHTGERRLKAKWKDEINWRPNIEAEEKEEE